MRASRFLAGRRTGCLRRSWPGLAAAIGRFDADIEVVGPTELKDAFAHLARRYANAIRL